MLHNVAHTLPLGYDKTACRNPLRQLCHGLNWHN